DNVTLVRSGAIATVTLDRPDKRNSLSDAMLSELGVAFTELRDDPATRVVIVTGAPPVFSAGADAPHARAQTDEERRRLFLSPRRSAPTPTCCRRSHSARSPRSRPASTPSRASGSPRSTP